MKTPRLRFAPLALAAMLATGATAPAQGASCTWLPATGNWNVAANWSCGIVPSGPGGDSATIGAGNTVTVNAAQSIHTLNNAGAINIDAFLLALQVGGSTTNTGTIKVGGPATGALQVSHGLNNAGGVIDIGAGSVVDQFGVTISGGTISGAGKVQPTNNGGNFLSGVTLNAALDLAAATRIQRISNGLTLGGTVEIGSNSIFAPQGDQTIGGTGTISFADLSGSNRFNVEAGNLTLGAGLTVRGGNGFIGAQSFVGGAATLTNQGLIAADTNGATIVVQVNGTTFNTSTMKAQGGGTLDLRSALDNTGGTLLADNGGTVFINNAAVTGGTLSGAGTGRFSASNSSGNLLNGLRLTGVLDLASTTGIARVTSGGMVLDGRVDIGKNSVFAPQGNQTIGGNGQIVFADSSGSNRLNIEAGATTLGAGITVRGHTGVIGQQNFVGGGATLANDGTIQADIAGGTVTLQVNGLTTNNGTLAALNGGTLNLNSPVTGTAGSQILAGALSVVNQNGVTLSGNMNLTGAGSFRPNGSGINFLSGVTLSGVLDLDTATGIERVVGGLTLNNATIRVGKNSVFAPQGDQTIGGTGTLVFTDANGSNRLNVEAGNLILAPGVTVRGGNGFIGAQSFIGGAATLTNNGTIQADEAGRSIAIQVNGLTTNNGTLAALNGGTLNLNSPVTGTAGSQILAGALSVVNQNGVTLSGNMNLTGAGSFRPNSSGSNFLSGVTLSGTLDLASATGIEQVSGGLTLAGASIDIGANSVFAPRGDQTIAGNGSIVFADASGSNRFNVEAGTLTLAPGITVRGGNGTIGNQSFVGGAATLINQGVIAADVAGRTISVNVNTQTVNQNLMKAENGGTLALVSSPVDNSAGTLLAADGSVVSLQGLAVTGGALNSAGSGVFRPNGSSSNFLQGVTLGGVLDMASATGITRISAGGMTVNGRIDIGAGSILAPQGDQTISGSGQIVFADGNGGNRINLEAGNHVFESGLTVRGQTGVIGNQSFVGGAATLTNRGTIASDGGGTITVAPTGALTNDGLMRAQAGNLVVQRAMTGTGTLQVDATGAMTLANGGNSQGRLLMGAAGAAIDIGSGNLVILSDYTNDAAGSGNGFNRRAGVSGAGQVVAAPNAAQAITGATVTNGNTANATLALGNVRVGTPTTVNYQIANSGTTGPTLRGAIQTSANGANLTDPRLSGAGVTASNYNAGAPGGSSGDLGVTFLTGAAGPIAPLVGQVLNLRSNFENIADQKLNIVLGAGAGAYVPASGSLLTAPLNFGTVQVGQSVSQALAIRNTAAGPAGFVEDLNARFGAASGLGAALISGAGQITGLGAGATSTGVMTVNVNTAVPGVVNGSIPIDFFSAGTVGGAPIAGLAEIGVGSAPFGVQGTIEAVGNVIDQARPVTNGVASPNAVNVNLGNLRIGNAASQSLSVLNQATGNQQAALNATIASNGAPITAAGSFALLAPGATSNALSVGIGNAAPAGPNNGTATISFVSDANNVGNCAPNCQLNLAPQTVNVTANVYRLANPALNTPEVTIAARVGDPVAANRPVPITNASPDIFTEGLNVAITGATGNAQHNGGSITNLIAGGTNNAAITVGLASTAAAGLTQATVGLAFGSTGAGTTGAPDAGAGTASVTVNGRIYTPAAGRLGAPVLDFGIVRVGDNVTRNAEVGNTAATTALNDTLRALLSGLSGPFGGNGSVGGIAAQASSSLPITLDTAAAGLFSQSGTVSYLSQNPDMADASGGPNQNLQVLAQINNLANADFDLLAGLGLLTQSGSDYLLNLGNIVVGSNVTSMLQLDNDVLGPADDLANGAFDLSAVDDFALAGWNPLALLAPGQAAGGLSVSFVAGNVGLFEDQVLFGGRSVNASDPAGIAQTRRLIIRANVIDAGGTVPEPHGLPLVLAAAAAAAVARRRRAS
jgi:hypothetical protein